MPALLTRMSSPSKTSSAEAASRSTSPASARSAGMIAVRTPPGSDAATESKRGPVAAAEHDVGAGRGQPGGDRGADPARRPGDQGPPAGQHSAHLHH